MKSRRAPDRSLTPPLSQRASEPTCFASFIEKRANKKMALSLVDTNRAPEWGLILSHTREMLKAAEAADWEVVIRLERERGARLAQFFAAPPADHERTWVRSGIEEILDSDERVVALCQAGKATVSSKIVALRRQADADRAYRTAVAD